MVDDDAAPGWPPESHLLQGHLRDAQIMQVLRVGTAIWHTRCTIASGHAFADRAYLLQHLKRAVCDPVYNQSTSRQRQVVAPLPLPVGAVLYRTDGAAKGQGQRDSGSGGAGAVCFGDGGDVVAWMSESLGDVSNNFAEYVGAIRAFERVERQAHPIVALEMDSKLVCCQLRGEWQVRASELKVLFRNAFAILCRMRSAGIRVHIRHIYREYNVEADGRAKASSDGVTASHSW